MFLFNFVVDGSVSDVDELKIVMQRSGFEYYVINSDNVNYFN